MSGQYGVCPSCGGAMEAGRTVCVFCDPLLHGTAGAQTGSAPSPAGAQRVCGMCGAPMPPHLVTCAACEAGKVAPPPAAVVGPLLVGLLLPILGLVLGLIRAFDADPRRKAEAGPYFGGTAAGFVLGLVLLKLVLPVMEVAPAGPQYNAGVAASRDGKLQEAEEHYRKAIKTDPGYAAAWVNLAAVQLRQHDGAGGEASARKAIALLDSGRGGEVPAGDTVAHLRTIAHGNLAGALIIERKYAEASREAEQTLEMDPEYEKAPNLRRIIELCAPHLR